MACKQAHGRYAGPAGVECGIDYHSPLTTYSWLQVSQQQSSLSGVQQQATMVQSVHVGSSGILQFAATTTGAFDTVSAVFQTAGHASH